jgi:hypothetical protein
VLTLQSLYCVCVEGGGARPVCYNRQGRRGKASARQARPSLTMQVTMLGHQHTALLLLRGGLLCRQQIWRTMLQNSMLWLLA